jgi:hypothetical protein
VYGLPFDGTRIFQSRIAQPCTAWTRTHIKTPAARATAPMRAALRRVAAAACGCWGVCHCCSRQHSVTVDTLGLPPIVIGDAEAAPAAMQFAAVDAKAGAEAGAGAGGAAVSSSPDTVAEK